MKITIEIPELDHLSTAQTELDTLDRELSELIAAIAAGEQAPTGKPFAVQLQQLLNKAAHVVKNTPVDDTQVYMERYAQGYSAEIASGMIAPYFREIENRVKQLQNKLKTPRSSQFTTSHIQPGHILQERLGREAFINLQQHIAQQVETQLNEQLADKVTG